MAGERSERGAVLVLALVFTTVIGLIVAALLALGATQFRAADAFRERRDGVFAADAGLERALSTIGLFAAAPGSTGSDTCTDPGACPLTPALDSRKESVGTSPMTVSNVVLGRGRGSNRMVVVATGAGSASEVVAVTFAGTPMHRLTGRTAQACWLIVYLCAGRAELWYLLDAELPAAAGPYPVRVDVGNGRNVAVHASSWLGVLQQIDGAPYVPTAAGTSLQINASSVSTTINAGGADTLVLSAAVHVDDDWIFGCSRDDAATGSGAGIRLTNGPHPSCAGMATSYAIRPAGAQSVSETFLTSTAANAHVVGAFRAASSAPAGPPVFGATCTDTPLRLSGINGYEVAVVCQMTSESTLAITATATESSGDPDGRTSIGHATVTRLDDGTVEVSEWDTRPEGR